MAEHINKDKEGDIFCPNCNEHLKYDKPKDPSKVHHFRCCFCLKPFGLRVASQEEKELFVRGLLGSISMLTANQ